MKIIGDGFVKRALLFIIIVHFSIPSFAAIYYVSNAGNDTNTGLTTTLPWKSLTKVNATTFQSGDQILFQKGDTFYGTITIKNSGSAGNPITFGAYGTGANPVITGFTTITGWTNEGSGIYSKAIIAESSTNNIVTVNGVNTAMGRWPNTGYMTYESHSGNTSITDNQLTGTPNWTGAELVLRRTQWTLNRNLITNHTGSVITYSPDANTWDGPTDGYGYFIQNGLNTLDVLGEWYYNGTTLYMYFGANDPSSYTVKISTLNVLLSSGTSYSTRKHYITVDNITFEGSSLNAIFLVQLSTGWTIQNCAFSLNGRNGIFAEQTSYLTINNNTFDNINNNAIANHWEQNNLMISNNTISNIGTLPGMGTSDDFSYDGIQILSSTTVSSAITIEHNTIQHTGHSGIRMKGMGINVDNNIISDFGLVKADVGGIYTSQANTITISNNIILNSTFLIEAAGTNGTWTQGIYLDNYSHDITISGNTVYNILGDGIGVQSSQNIEISNNTVFACGYAQLAINSNGSDTKVTGINVHDNIFVAKSAGGISYPYSPMAARVTTYFSDISTWGTLDNNYYCRPIDDSNVFRRYDITDPWNGVGLTLAQWKSFSGKDANSHKSPQAITSESDLQFEHNATTIAKTVTLNTPMIDVKGTKYATTVTLQPFTSIVLMKDLTAATVPDAPTSVVATAGNASASVTFVAPINNGGSVITGYTVTSIPAGAIDANAGITSLTHNITGLTNGTSYTFTVKATNSVGSSLASAASNLVIPSAPAATTFIFSGPSSGNVNNVSTNFTVTPNNIYTGTITITLSGTGSTGLLAKVLTFSNSSTAQTFSITPTVAGSITLTATNSGTLTNPANLTYTVNAVVPGAPTSVVATAENASASVTFLAPISNGGSVITGYTVISIPAGGTDSNAGSTSLTHVITGLTNGTSYTFTVKATNSVGSSVASVASNLVIPSAPTATTFTFSGPSSGSVNSGSTNFTVTPNNLFTGTITITPSGTGGTGLITKVLTFSNSSTAQTFAITPTFAGIITLTATNSSTLSNPANLTYIANAVVPGAPTSVVATAGNNTTSVTFAAPVTDGGSVVTGYTVTSIPAGGTDTNAGSVTLTHILTGLTNDISYTFTVQATNSVGNSIASVASDPVIPSSAYLKQGEILPTHFIPVWQGQNGLNHMNVMVVSATLNDVPITTNDEVALFSGTKCVGSQKLGTTLVATDNSTYLNIIASQDDGTGNGFTNQDTILFKIWDDPNQREMDIQGIIYRSDVSSWLTSGKFVPGGTAVVELISYTVSTQTIQMLKGYNMISASVVASNPDVSIFTQPIRVDGDLIKMQDESGNSYENWGTFGGWVNNLGSIDQTEGYKIKVANDCSLQIIGRSVLLPLDIPLKTGWNMIPFPCSAPADAKMVIQTLIDQNKLIKVQDEEGNSIENWGVFGGWQNGIGNFIPGKAYKVKVVTDATLTIQENYLKSAIILSNTPKTEYFSTTIEGHGTDHMNLNIVAIREAGLSVGDELAAFDGPICVGTRKLIENNLNQNTVSLIASFSTDDQIQNGFKSGDPIKIFVWKQVSNSESEAQLENLSGTMSYEKNGSVLLKMKSLVTGKSSLNGIAQIDVFPNPSIGRVTVRFSEMPDANSRIAILDISGRTIISRNITGTSEEFNLDTQPAGLYLVKTITGSIETTHKLIIRK